MDEMFLFEPEDDMLLFDPALPPMGGAWWDAPYMLPNRDEEILLF